MRDVACKQKKEKSFFQKKTAKNEIQFLNDKLEKFFLAFWQRYSSRVNGKGVLK